MEMNAEQTAALEAIKQGGNYLITGGAGVGKSTLLKELSKMPNTVFAAPTAAAAFLIGGMTLHRLFALPVLDVIDAVNLPPPHRKTQKLIGSIKTLVIDEISMVRSDIFAAVDQRLRQCGPDSDLPFGGVQLILCGDFLQLPPVVRNIAIGNQFIPEYLKKTYQGIYAYSTPLWKKANIRTLYLHCSMRQKDDADYSRSLNIIRMKDNTRLPMALELLNQRVTHQIPETAIRLCATHREAKSVNESFYAQIDAPEYQFSAIVTGYFPHYVYPNEMELRVKCGERVLVTANLAPEVRNGTIGTIQSINDEEICIAVDVSGTQIIYPVKRYEYKQYSYKLAISKITNKQIIEATEIGSFIQFPLLPAWAITIHRAQGMTLDQVALNIHGQVLESGQCYVALSRCRSLQGLFLETPLQTLDIHIEKEVLFQDLRWRYNSARFSAVMREFLFFQYSEVQLEMLSTCPWEAEEVILHVVQLYLQSLEEPAQKEYKEPSDQEKDHLWTLYYNGCDIRVNRHQFGLDSLTNHFHALVNLYIAETAEKADEKVVS